MPRRKKQKPKEMEKPMIYIDRQTISGVYHGAKWLIEHLIKPPTPAQVQKTESPLAPETPKPEPLPSFIEEQTILAKRRLEHEKIGKELLKRLK